MKRIASLVLAVLTVFSLCSCSTLQQKYESLLSDLEKEINAEQIYSPCEDDFANISSPKGEIYAYNEYTPSKDSFYYFVPDSIGAISLYRATDSGTECIAKESLNNLAGYRFDGWLQGVGDEVYYSAYESAIFSSTGLLFKYDPKKNTSQELVRKDFDFGDWKVCGDFFIYIPFKPATTSEGEPNTFPYETYSLYTLNLATKEEKQIAQKDVLYFDVFDDKIYYVTYDDGFCIFSCGLDGTNTSYVGKMSFEFSPDYDSLWDFRIGDGYAVFQGELGNDMTQTDIVVYSMENGTTKQYSFEMYASNFDVVGGYAFASMVINYGDMYETVVPAATEGIYRINLSDGTEELLCNAFAYNEGILVFDEECVYTLMPCLVEEEYYSEIYRVRKDETPVKVYAYKP